MSLTRSRLILLIVLLGVLLPTAVTQAQTDSITQQSAEAEWSNELERLDPAQPEAYFLLAEEVAALARTREDVALARRLFMIAYELDSEAEGAFKLRASAAIGLASLARSDRERRWLLAIARMLDPRHALPAWAISATEGITDADAVHAAETLVKLRSGRGNDAKKALDDPGVRVALDRLGHLITGTPTGSLLSEFDRLADLWPCPECRNERVSSVREGRQVRLVLCFTCGGNPGPRLRPEELAGYLRMESALLRGDHTSWAAQLFADGGSPLRDPQPSELTKLYGLNTSARLYRDGAWITQIQPADSPEAAP